MSVINRIYYDIDQSNAAIKDFDHPYNLVMTAKRPEQANKINTLAAKHGIKLHCYTADEVLTNITNQMLSASELVKQICSDCAMAGYQDNCVLDGLSAINQMVSDFTMSIIICFNINNDRRTIKVKSPHEILVDHLDVHHQKFEDVMMAAMQLQHCIFDFFDMLLVELGIVNLDQASLKTIEILQNMMKPLADFMILMLGYISINIYINGNTMVSDCQGGNKLAVNVHDKFLKLTNSITNDFTGNMQAINYAKVVELFADKQNRMLISNNNNIPTRYQFKLLEFINLFD